VSPFLGFHHADYIIQGRSFLGDVSLSSEPHSPASSCPCATLSAECARSVLITDRLTAQNNAISSSVGPLNLLRCPIEKEVEEPARIFEAPVVGEELLRESAMETVRMWKYLLARLE
jgi:hypothetical protein